MQQGSISVKILTVKKLTVPGIVKILTMIVFRTKQEQKNSQVVGFFIWLPSTVTAGQLTFF